MAAQAISLPLAKQLDPLKMCVLGCGGVSLSLLSVCGPGPADFECVLEGFSALR